MKRRPAKTLPAPGVLVPGAVFTALAIDPGTHTGWAWARVDSPVMLQLESGTEVFDLRRGESAGLRFMRFRSWLVEMLAIAQPNVVLYEAAHHRGGAATEVCVGMTTRVQEAAAAAGIEYAAVHTATLKKAATGNGRAGKDEMIAAARRACVDWGRPGREPRDDNEADALCLLRYGFDLFL